MSTLSALADFIAALSFIAAFAVVLTIPTSKRGIIPASGKWFAAAALSLYAFGAMADLLEVAASVDLLGDYEGFLEVLFPPLALLCAQSVLARQQFEDVRASAYAAEVAHEMMLDIVETTPAGVMVLDGGGRITFANEVAKNVLDLTEQDSGFIETPGWVVTDSSGALTNGFSLLTDGRTHTNVPVHVAWPEGDWIVDLEVSALPLKESAGVVAAFPVPRRG